MKPYNVLQIIYIRREYLISYDYKQMTIIK